MNPKALGALLLLLATADHSARGRVVGVRNETHSIGFNHSLLDHGICFRGVCLHRGDIHVRSPAGSGGRPGSSDKGDDGRSGGSSGGNKGGPPGTSSGQDGGNYRQQFGQQGGDSQHGGDNSNNNKGKQPEPASGDQPQAQPGSNDPNIWVTSRLAGRDDMTAQDWTDFKKAIDFFKPPDTNNWVFYSGKKTRKLQQYEFRNALEMQTADDAWPLYDPKYLGKPVLWDDMYDAAFKYKQVFPVRKDLEWKPVGFISQSFAESAKGKVHLVIPQGMNWQKPYGAGTDSYWFDFELWELTKPDGNVDEIAVYRWDQKALKGVNVWRRGDPQMGKKPSFDKPKGYPNKG